MQEVRFADLDEIGTTEQVGVYERSGLATGKENKVPKRWKSVVDQKEYHCEGLW